MLLPLSKAPHDFLLALFSTADVQRHLDLPTDCVNIHNIAEIYAHYSTPQRISFCILSENQYAGFISAASNAKHKTASLSFALLPQFRHKKLIQSSIDEMYTILQQQSIVRIEAQVLCENQASVHVLQQCGFTCEGILQQNFMIENCLMDSFMMAKIIA
ncbi:MAG: GNAT family N-acetyltransferase [Bacteroidetes bacterium]|nr:GNAT family N-acetyltransferase [Bacteroidota bacterium]